MALRPLLLATLNCACFLAANGATVQFTVLDSDTDAVNLLFAATGGSGVYLDQPIQRAFRDAHAANAHYALSWDVNGTQWGRIALGLPAEPIVL